MNRPGAEHARAEYDGVLKTPDNPGDFKANVLKLNIPATISKSPSMVSPRRRHSGSAGGSP